VQHRAIAVAAAASVHWCTTATIASIRRQRVSHAIAHLHVRRTGATSAAAAVSSVSTSVAVPAVLLLLLLLLLLQWWWRRFVSVPAVAAATAVVVVVVATAVAMIATITVRWSLSAILSVVWR
jgi:MFS superfamily sulfate permease-like transporter